MKKLVFIAVVLASFSAFAQVDSSKLYVKTVAIQARDLEAIAQLLTSDEMYEDFFQLAKAKFNGANPPSNTSSVTIDSVRIDALIGLYRYTQAVQIGLATNYVTRIQTTLKALSSTYLQAQIAAIDAQYSSTFTATRQEGRRRLRQIRN